ncbi:MAG: hypothetical protein BMS9Abin01_0107 [Gammaproteobacteria bacterium]|nr:MAG: hypothetical protein BMS9Abin01_0107 [Gammaproteobacteria bacterium]
MWTAATLEKYLDATERLARKSAAEKSGEHTAKNLENIWADLTDEEKHFIEFLFLSEGRTVVALYEDGLFSALMSKGLLQIPPGVGTILMQHLETTYSIPIAVWKQLHEQPGLFFSHNENKKAQRLEELTPHFNDRVDALLKGPSPGGDV